MKHHSLLPSSASRTSSHQTVLGQSTWRAVLAVWRGELRRLLISPALYIVLTVFLAFWLLFFLRQVFFIGENSFRVLFDLLPWLCVFVVPVFTMGAFAKERSEQTLLWLRTRPVSDQTIVLGKFAAIASYICCYLLLVLPVAVVFSQLGSFSWPVLAAQMMGACLTVMLAVSVGLAASVWLKDQLAALLLAFTLLFGLNVLGAQMITTRVPSQVAGVLLQLSLPTRLNSLNTGLIDLKDITLFVLATALLLGLTAVILQRERMGAIITSKRRGVLLTIVLLVSAAVVSLLVQSAPQLDVTPTKQFSLSAPTKKVLADITTPVTITVYSSDTLPSQLQPVAQSVKNTLTQLERDSNSTVVVEYKNVTQDETARLQAEQAGVTAVQFNQISNESFQTNSGYFGAALTQAGEQQVLPYIATDAGFEFALTSTLWQLVYPQKPKIAFVVGHGENTLFGDLSQLEILLSPQFDLETINLTQDEAGTLSDSLDGFAAVVLAGPTGPFEPEVLAALQTYAQSGGSLLLLAEGMEVDSQTLVAVPAQSSVNDILSAYGLGVSQNLVYDLGSHESVELTENGASFFVEYPWWITAQIRPVAQAVGIPAAQVLLPWASEIGGSGSSDDSVQILPLLETSALAGSSSSAQLSLLPENTLSSDALGKYVLGAAAEKQLSASTSSRLIVFGDRDIFVNPVLQNSPSNAGVALASLAWLTHTDSLADLALKQSGVSHLMPNTFWQPKRVIAWSMSVVVISPLVVLTIVLYRRRKLRQRGWTQP